MTHTTGDGPTGGAPSGDDFSHRFVVEAVATLFSIASDSLEGSDELLQMIRRPAMAWAVRQLVAELAVLQEELKTSTQPALTPAPAPEPAPEPAKLTVHQFVVVSQLPPCNVAPCGQPAHYDFKTKSGPWGYGCEAHYKAHRLHPTLGIGKGQRLVLPYESTPTVESSQ